MCVMTISTCHQILPAAGCSSAPQEPTAAAPAVAKTRVANVLMALKLRGGAVDGAATAAQDIARSSAREALAPLMDAAAARLAAILRRTFDLALDTLSTFPGKAARRAARQGWLAKASTLKSVAGHLQA